MSNPKDKAIELFNKFKLEPIKPICIMHPQHWKQCALICVDEILNETRTLYDISWWSLVREEIEKL
jgi:hypothetical protein